MGSGCLEAGCHLSRRQRPDPGRCGFLDGSSAAPSPAPPTPQTITALTSITLPVKDEEETKDVLGCIDDLGNEFVLIFDHQLFAVIDDANIYLDLGGERCSGTRIYIDDNTDDYEVDRGEYETKDASFTMTSCTIDHNDERDITLQLAVDNSIFETLLWTGGDMSQVVNVPYTAFIKI